MKDKVKMLVITTAVGFVVWSFTAWAGHDTRISVLETDRKYFTESVKRIEKSIDQLLLRK